MKNISRFLPVLLFFVACFTACEEVENAVTDVPLSCFSFAPSSPNAGSKLSFTSCSEGALSYAWNFGDGNSSTSENPTHTYTTPGEYTVTLTVTNDNGSDSESKTITIGTPSTIMHTADIESDQTWKNTSVHVVTADIEINNATLTIEPGTVVKFDKGKALYVGYHSDGDATLVAKGTASQPITFTANSSSPEPADWDYIYFGKSSTSNCSLHYCTVQYAGGYATDHGAIRLVKANVSIENSIIQKSGGRGVSLDSESQFVSFTNNTIKELASAAVSIYPNAVHTLGANNTIQADGGILVNGGPMNVSDAVWQKQDVPYVINADIELGSSTNAKLTLNPGVVVAFNENGAFYFAYYNNEYITFVAEGTASEPIVFTSNSSTPKAGDWKRFVFYSGTSPSSVINHCVFEYGGGHSNNEGIIHLDEAEITIKNTTIRHAPSFGVSMNYDANFVAFENNTLTDIAGYELQVSPNAAHNIGTGNKFQSDNGILVLSGKFTKADATWLAHNTRYVIKGDITIGASNTASLSISPGTTVAFSEGAGLYIGYYNSEFGKLIADGLPNQPIVFTSAFPDGSKAAGQWDVMGFYKSTAAGSLLNNCVLEYGGGNTALLRCREVAAGFLSITNTTFRHSANDGIHLDRSAPTRSNNTFSNIAGIQVHE